MKKKKGKNRPFRRSVLHVVMKKKCVTVIEQLRCKQTAGTRGAAGNNKGTVTNPHFKKGSMGTNALDDANGWAVL